MIRDFYQSSIGKKWTVALTGLVLVGYVIGHLIGNLQVFCSPAQINAYGAFLHSHVILLWLVRIFLLVCFFTHIFATVQLSIENRAARPERYAVTERRRASAAGRTMLISGMIVLAFVVFHLLHFTAQVIDSSYQSLDDALGQHDVYRMIILGFHNPLVSGFYTLGLFLLCAHLSHAFGSVFQTLGLNTKRIAPFLVNGGRVLSWLIFVGYVSIPIAVMLHVLK